MSGRSGRTERTRTRAVTAFLVALAVALCLSTGCASTQPGQRVENDPTSGPTSRPADSDPGVVVALDDFAALNILALGLTPDLAYDAFGYATSGAVFAAESVPTKPYGAGLKVEELLAAKPDVIVGVSLPTTVEQQARLERIAPTAILEYTADWQSALRATGKALGRDARAEQVITEVEGDVAKLSADLEAAGLAGQQMSVIAGSPETVFSPPEKTNLGVLLSTLGFDRPAPQKAKVSASAPFVNISEETLPDNDGDYLYLLEGRSYPVEKLLDSSLYSGLEAVKSKKSYRVSGEMWFGSNPVSVRWVLDDIRATLLDGGSPIPEADAPERLRALVAATKS